ncbi:hypothetical protein E3N88_44033 [Mikania micrantha]|uniref:Glycosyltransferase 2-like domain-containing protein n=1 Tax=Mikania micrantha TaxID=192012 RepID=A0A5N6LDS8_9ASTR|nr:hypothetical protein E3N88_44033 [Mikania micrantha]
MPTTPILNSRKPSSKTWLNRVFTVTYTVAVSVHLLSHCRTLIHSRTLISVALFVADFVFAFFWLTSQCFHWNPIERQVFPETLKRVVMESEYPSIDVVICTADPTKEPPVGVVNTALSVLAYEYPTEKLSVYVSDDGGSEMTLYAFMECAKFAKHWIPYCKKHGVMERAPEVYFGNHPLPAWDPETHEIKMAKKTNNRKYMNIIDDDDTVSSTRLLLFDKGDRVDDLSFGLCSYTSLSNLFLPGSSDKEELAPMKGF